MTQKKVIQSCLDICKMRSTGAQHAMHESNFNLVVELELF